MTRPGMRSQIVLITPRSHSGPQLVPESAQTDVDLACARRRRATSALPHGGKERTSMRPWCSSLLSEVRSLGVLLRPKAAGYDKAMAAVLATRSPEFRKHLSNLLTEPPTDSQMRALLTGKSVIVIGPAGYTERRLGLSSSVSSFDVVVRPNAKVTHDGRLLLPPGTTDRCDVVYHSGVYLGKKLAGPNGLVAATQRNAMKL